MLRGGAISLSPGAVETRGPTGATRSPGGASRDERQWCSLEDKQERRAPAPPQFWSPSRLGCTSTPARSASRSPSLRQPIKLFGG